MPAQIVIVHFAHQARESTYIHQYLTPPPPVTQVNPYRCTNLTTWPNRNHHNRIHNLRFTCPVCALAFGLRTDMERHKRNIHKDACESLQVEVFKCTYIGCATPEKEFRRKDNFKRHVERCRKALESGNRGNERTLRSWGGQRR